LKIHGSRLDFIERQGVIYKYSGDFSGTGLFFHGKFGGPGPPSVDRAARLGSLLDRGGAYKRTWRHLVSARALGLASRGGGDESDEAVPEGCSLKHERRRRGSATVKKTSDSLSSLRGRSKARGISGARGSGSVRARGAQGLYRGSRGHRGGVTAGGNGNIMALTPLKVGAG
jgi:hypothetical protein